MKQLVPACFLALAHLPAPAHAVLLDCEINAQRIYTCVEVGPSAGTTETPPGVRADGEDYRRYLDQAQQECTYREPRRRTVGKNTGGAHRTEDLKAAQRAYDECISETARERWLKDNPPGASGE